MSPARTSGQPCCSAAGPVLGDDFVRGHDIIEPPAVEIDGIAAAVEQLNPLIGRLAEWQLWRQLIPDEQFRPEVHVAAGG